MAAVRFDPLEDSEKGPLVDDSHVQHDLSPTYRGSAAETLLVEEQHVGASEATPAPVAAQKQRPSSGRSRKVTVSCFSDLCGIGAQDLEREREFEELMRAQHLSFRNFDIAGEASARERIGKRYKCILHPNTPFRHIWNIIVLALVIYTAVAVPMDLAFFAADNSVWALALDSVVDFLFIIDVALNFRTAYHRADKVLIKDARQIGRHYVRSWFFIDVVSAIPVDLILLISGAHSGDDATAVSKLLGALKSLRLLRIGKALRFLRQAQFSPVLGVVRLYGAIALMAHWAACAWWGITTNIFSDDGESWATVTGLMNKSLFAQYSASLLAALLGTLRTMPDPPVTTAEHLFLLAAVFVGLGVGSALIGQVGYLISSIGAKDNEYRRATGQVLDRLRYYNVPVSLRDRVDAFLEAQWEHHRATSSEEVDLFTRGLSEPLRLEISLYMNRDMVSKVPLLKDIDSSSLIAILRALRTRLYMPGDVIVQQGDAGHSMYFVRKGVCSVLVRDDVDPTAAPESAHGGTESVVEAASRLRTMTARAIPAAHSHVTGSTTNADGAGTGAGLRFAVARPASDSISEGDRDTVRTSTTKGAAVMRQVVAGMSSQAPRQRRRSTTAKMWDWTLDALGIGAGSSSSEESVERTHSHASVRAGSVLSADENASALGMPTDRPPVTQSASRRLRTAISRRLGRGRRVRRRRKFYTSASGMRMRAVRRLGEGGFFGEVSLLFNISRTATIVARTFADLAELDRPTFEEILDANPNFASVIESNFATYLQQEHVAREIESLVHAMATNTLDRDSVLGGAMMPAHATAFYPGHHDPGSVHEVHHPFTSPGIAYHDESKGMPFSTPVVDTRNGDGGHAMLGKVPSAGDSHGVPRPVLVINRDAQAGRWVGGGSVGSPDVMATPAGGAAAAGVARGSEHGGGGGDGGDGSPAPTQGPPSTTGGPGSVPTPGIAPFTPMGAGTRGVVARGLRLRLLQRHAGGRVESGSQVRLASQGSFETQDTGHAASNSTGHPQGSDSSGAVDARRQSFGGARLTAVRGRTQRRRRSTTDRLQPVAPDAPVEPAPIGAEQVHSESATTSELSRSRSGRHLQFAVPTTSESVHGLEVGPGVAEEEEAPPAHAPGELPGAGVPVAGAAQAPSEGRQGARGDRTRADSELTASEDGAVPAAAVMVAGRRGLHGSLAAGRHGQFTVQPLDIDQASVESGSGAPPTVAASVTESSVTPLLAGISGLQSPSSVAASGGMAPMSARSELLPPPMSPQSVRSRSRRSSGTLRSMDIRGSIRDLSEASRRRRSSLQAAARRALAAHRQREFAGSGTDRTNRHHDQRRRNSVAGIPGARAPRLVTALSSDEAVGTLMVPMSPMGDSALEVSMLSQRVRTLERMNAEQTVLLRRLEAQMGRVVGMLERALGDGAESDGGGALPVEVGLRDVAGASGGSGGGDGGATED